MLLNRDDEERKKRLQEAMDITNRINNSGYNNYGSDFVPNNNNSNDIYNQRLQEAMQITNSINPINNIQQDSFEMTDAPTIENITDNINTNKEDDDTQSSKKKIEILKGGAFTKGNGFNMDTLSDGYQFGDLFKSALAFGGNVLKTAAGTVTDIVGDASSGVVSVGENVVDLGANIVASIQNLFGNKEGAKNIREWANKNYSEKIGNAVANVLPVGILYNAMNGTLNENAFENTAFEKGSVLGDTSDKVVNLAGYTVGLALGTKGLDKLGTAMSGAKAAGTTAKTAKTLGNIPIKIGSRTLSLPTLAVVGGAAGGFAEANAKGEDVTELERWNKALSGGVIEGVTEGLFGMLGVGGNEITDKWAKDAASKFTSKAGKMLAKIGVQSSGEAAEEFLSYLGNHIVDNYWIDRLGKTDFSSEWDWGEVGEQMALAFASSMLSSGGNIAIQSNIATRSAEKQLGRKLTQQEKNEITKQLVDEALEEKENIQFDPENKGKDVDTFYVSSYNSDGEINEIVETKGKVIENPNKKVDVNPIIIKDKQTNTYNIMDGNTGVLLDTTPYQTLNEAQIGFNSKMINLDEASIKGINQKIQTYNLEINKKIGEYVIQNRAIENQQNNDIEQNIISTQEINNQEIKTAQNGISEQIDSNNISTENKSFEDVAYDAMNNYESTEVQSPLQNRNIETIGKQTDVKAYQYENPEVKPYFQEMAQMIGEDLSYISSSDNRSSVKGGGTKLNTTTKAITTLHDEMGYSYDQIAKGLQNIIKDSGKENNAISKKLELIIDEQLRNGYTNALGKNVEPNQKYINIIQKNGKLELPIKQKSEKNAQQINELGGEILTKETRNNFKMQNIAVIENKKSLINKIEKALKQEDRQTNFTIGGIKQKTIDRIKSDINYNIFKERQYSLIINDDDIIHISKHYNSTEKIAEEIIRLLDIVDNYDSVNLKLEGTEKKLIFEKSYPHADIRSVELVSNNKNSLNLVTVYYTKKRGQFNQSVTSNFNGNSQLESTSYSNNSIPQKTKNVKSDKTVINKDMQKDENNSSNKSTSQNNNNIQDFGEKIGGARKDTSMPRGTTKISKEVIHDYTVKNTDNGYSVDFKGKVLQDGFKTQKEAEEYILAFKDNVKSHLATVEKSHLSNEYIIKILNPRTLKASYTNKKFSNLQDAESYAMALSIYLKENGKNLFRPQIQKVERINQNSKNATKTTGDNILSNFGFKGGEFGNWVTQNERQQFLNYAQDAFTDLAAALDVLPSDLGQNGDMSIAFGARGKGLTGAVAHFEPGKKVINMTRLKGAGSLAHEYGHSIDNWLSRISGYDKDGMATENAIARGRLPDNLRKAVNEVTDALNYNTSKNQEEVDKKNAIYEKQRISSLEEYHLKDVDRVFEGKATTYKYNRTTKEHEQVPIKVTEEQKNEYQKIRKILIEGKLKDTRNFDYSSLSSNKVEYDKPLEDLRKLYKEVVGRKLNDDTVYGIYSRGKASKQVTEVKTESAYRKSAIELDKMMGRKSLYYSRTDEMWARAFEAYVSDKLKAKGITDTYLVHSVNNSDYALFNPFPAGEERQNINKAFDNLIQTMKDENILHDNNYSDSNDNSNNSDNGIRYLKKNNSKKSSSIMNNYDESTSNRIKMNTRNIIVENDNQLSNLVNEALSTNKNKALHLGKLDEKTINKIKENIQNLPQNKQDFLKKNTYDLVINQSEIRHLIEDKSTLTEEDVNRLVKLIPEIIADSDYISYSNNLKDEGLRFKKLLDDGTYVSFVIVSNKQGTMKVKTVFMEKGDYENKKQSISPSNNANRLALDNTSKTNGASASNNSIPQNSRNVKNQGIKINKESKNKPYQTNGERADAWIEQEIKKVEETGNWDNTIPVTSLTDTRNTIEDYLGLGIKKGKFRQSAYALYKGTRDVIRTKEYKDIDSILHETGHALDLGNRLNLDKESIADELLNAVSKLEGYEDESRTVKLEEGFAEVIREYSIVPEQAKADYPQSVAVLEQIRKADKSFNDFMTKVQQQTYNYIHQNPQNRVHSNISIGQQTDKAPLTKAWVEQEVMRNVYDKDYAVKKAVSEMAKINNKTTNQLKASNNAYYLTRLASGIHDKAISMLSDGYIDEQGKKTMPGLNKIGEILGDDPQRYNDLRDYLVAKRDTDYKAKTLKTGIRDMDTKFVLEKFANDTQIKEAAQLVYDTLDGVMQYAVNNGLISQEDVTKLKESNAFYVPMQRVIEGRGNQLGRRGAVSDIIKARTGSELDIKDVLENIVANSSNVIQQVENNNILKALYNQGEEAGLTGSIYDVIDAPMIKVGTANLNMWENELKKQGVNTANLDLEKTIDIFAPNNKVDSKNLITSFINENGNRVYLQFNDEILFNSLLNMDKQFMSQVLQINRKLNMPLRYGATMANLGFAIPNMISDTAQAAIFSNAGFVPVVDNALGVLDILTATNKHVKKFVENYSPEYVKRIENMYQLYKQTGATSSTRMSQFRDSTQGNMKDVYGTKNSETLGIDEKWKPFKRLLDILTYIPEVSEQSTRFRVFEKNYEMYKQKGNNETDARILAALESRDATQDFGRTGNLTREINQLIPFSAARVGSAYTFAEKVKANPKQTAMRIAVLTAIGMAIKAIGYKDKEIEELNQRKKDDNFVMKVGNNVVTIKKPQGILRSMINLAEYIEDLSTGHIQDGKEGERLGEWINNAIMDNMPADSVTGLVPNMVAPLIENAINRDLYYNTDIVKSYDLNLPDSQQYYEYNSQLAILLGKAFNYSPAKIDNLISGYFAGLGTQVTGIMDYVSGKMGITAQKAEMGAESNAIGKRFIVNVNSNSASVDEIYNRKTELTKKQNGGTISPDEEEELSNITEATANMSKLNKQIKEIKKSMSLSGKEKAEQIKLLQQQRTDIARQALDKDLLHQENASEIEVTSFYPTNSSLSLNNYKLELTGDMKQEYAKLASEFYKKYESQGLYNEDKLKEIKTKAKDYAKKTLMQKYKSQLIKSK